MKRKLLVTVCLCFGLSAFALAGCGSNSGSDAAASAGTESTADAQTADAAVSAEAESADEAANGAVLEDGTYVADFTTDNSMFHVNEANHDKGILTVENGEMTIHVSLQSKKIVNLYPGLAEDAQKEGAELLEPTTDTVTYDDGMTSEVYGFDIPVPALDTEFDVALIGTKGTWYDHKVVVSNPVSGDNIQAALEANNVSNLEDGEYSVDVAKEGGSGKAEIESPTTMTVADGAATMIVTWSSPNYDYMLVNDEKYLPVNEEGNSVFEIPVSVINEPFTVIGDTTAMSEPHEIEYELTVTLAE